MKKEELTIVDLKTGEKLSLDNATPGQVSMFLTDINFKRKQLEKIEKKVKDHVKKSINEDELHGKGFVMYGEHKVSSFTRHFFDIKRLEKEGTEVKMIAHDIDLDEDRIVVVDEKKVMKLLKAKYTKGTRTAKV